MAVDENENVYVTGSSDEASWLSTSGLDVVLLKYSKEGTLGWAKTVGSKESDAGYAGKS